MGVSAATIRESRNHTLQRSWLMAGSTTIYKGALVMINSAGLAVPAAAAAGNHGVVGVATATVTSDASTPTFITVQEGEFRYAGQTLAQTGVGDVVYADDAETVDETQATNAPQAGIMTQFISATEAWVSIGLNEGR